MIRTILIDDEPLSRDIVRSYLTKYPDVKVVAECDDGFEGLKAITHERPDLLFLDIQMPKINGFEMLELIDEPPSVIFTTAYDEFAIKAFETNALDYLLKPFSEERFRQSMEKFLERQTRGAAQTDATAVAGALSAHEGKSERIVVRTGARVKIIPWKEIHYVEADDDYVRIVTAEGQFLKNRTMQQVENALDENRFVRVHRSYLLNVDLITRIEPYLKESYLAILRSGAQVPVSKNGYGRLKDRLGI